MDVVVKLAPVPAIDRQRWWERYEVYCNRRSECWFCGGLSVELFIPHGWFGVGRSRTQKLYAQQVCDVCFEHEFATIEARDEERRLTVVEIHDRCICGRAMLSMIGECVGCHREQRMLGKQRAYLRRTRRMLETLRKTIRNVKEAARAS